ncbi:hypothetical protein POX_c04571 [Penicillium oxalicum]|uniref:hypothetical protein n=1 Tax=Penicillium oxalicum TaxID=69781 RepID=UPI0020B83A86|nr:hypothetical protein POX_c04571 [Penicillium oxalicum]KAI2791700.1 hypothetical protein POX_c04571 [Penicillium oxalicum]
MSTTEASIFITPRYIFPIIAGGSLILIVPVTCAAIRTRHVQFALKCHYLLAVVATSTLGYHLLKQQSLYRWVLLGALCLWAVTSLTVSISTVWSRKPWRHDRQEVSMNASNGLLWLEVDLPPTWAVQPGQYVQLWMPSAGIRAGLQLPIFYVAVCKKDGAYKIARMVARSRSGIIRKLYDRNLASPRVNRIPVTVLGPYGRPENLLRFGTVVLVVEDVGFFRALSYIEMLVKASVQRKALVRKLEILWQDDGESSESSTCVPKWSLGISADLGLETIRHG